MTLQRKNSKVEDAISDSSSDSLGAFPCPKPRVSNELPLENDSGSESSPLPASTPFGRKGKKGLLGDPNTFKSNLLKINDHFSLDQDEQSDVIRDFEPEAATPLIGERHSMQQPRLQPIQSTPVELRPVKVNSNPFNAATNSSPGEAVEPATPGIGNQINTILRPPIGLGKPMMKVPSKTMQRTISTQDYDNTLETFNMRQEAVQAIEENTSYEERGGMPYKALMNPPPFQGLSATTGINQLATDMQRSFSIQGNPDSPSASIRNAQVKEKLRKQYQNEAVVKTQTYQSLEGTQLQIEGPYHMKDKDMSYSYINACKELKDLEQGIPFDPQLLLTEHANANKKTDNNLVGLADFEARIAKRKTKVEHSILQRLNCHKEKFDLLHKSFNKQFIDRNRYPDMLPFTFNRVKLNVNSESILYPTRGTSNSFTKLERNKPFQSVYSAKPRTEIFHAYDEQLPVFQVHSARPSSQSIAQPAAPGEECFDDYINASWIDSCLKKQLMIAASAPKQQTVCEFLQMIMENNVKLVMKVCEDKVNGREQCFRYTGKTPTTLPELALALNMTSDTNACSSTQSPDRDLDDSKSTKSANDGTKQTVFEKRIKDGYIKYFVDVTSTKKKFKDGLLIRKVTVTRKEYRKGQDFFDTTNLKSTQDDNDGAIVTDTKLLEETKQIDSKSSSTTKAELDQPLLAREDVHNFTQIVDLVWEDQKPPTSRGDQRLNYLRMAYMVKKMIKQARKQNPIKPQPFNPIDSYVPDQRILVHCSAGRGRTGTLIAAFLIAEHLLNISETIFPGSNTREQGFKQLREEPDSFYIEYPDKETLSSSMLGSANQSWSRISIFGLVRRLREQRWCMVSTDAQYAYCYQFLNQWVKQGETARLRAQLDRLYDTPNLNE